MKTLFDTATSTELLNRIEKLQPTTKRQWGKMNVDQMLLHCTQGVEMAIGIRIMERVFIGRIIGPMLKNKVLKENAIDRNSPTVKEMLITNTLGFEAEKAKLIKTVKDFTAAGKSGIIEHKHPFFGKMNSEEWGISAASHLDHHLKQFNV